MVKNGENIEERDVKESKSRDQKWKDSGENKWRDNYTSDVIDTANAEGNDEVVLVWLKTGCVWKRKKEIDVMRVMCLILTVLAAMKISTFKGYF
jgi:hypothetical protein